jgi:hypothetical protein
MGIRRDQTPPIMPLSFAICANAFPVSFSVPLCSFQLFHLREETE